MTLRSFTILVLLVGVRPAMSDGMMTATGQGPVQTPTFYRHDLGPASGRLHEPSADDRGNLWTSPLDQSLWRYDTRTGQLEIVRLAEVKADEDWGGHLWPVAYGREVYLCCPTKRHLPVYDQDRRTVTNYALPAGCGPVYGGFASSARGRICFYTTGQAGTGGAVMIWDPATHTGEVFACPYPLSGELYMTFLSEARGEMWGSTYTGNDLVRFDLATRQWTGHWQSPLAGATPTPANAAFGDTLYVSDHLGGRLLPFTVRSGTWGEPIPVPGYKEWFGYLSGGWAYQGLIYFVHSTWTGGTNSMDGKPHHFLGSLTVFDPRTRQFSRLDVPARPGEEFMCDYLQEVEGRLYLLAVNSAPPKTAVVVGTAPSGTSLGLPGARTLPLTVHAAAAVPGRPSPVTGGVPFPRDELAVTDRVRLFDRAGTELPLQTEVLATWEAERRSVQWLLLDFQVAGLTPGLNEVVLAYGPGPTPAAAPPPVDPARSPWPPERIVRSLYMTDQAGRRYRADWDREGPSMETETAGPLRTVVRVHVWHADEDGKRFCRAILRLHYYAGLDEVRVFHSFVMDADPQQHQVRGLGLEVLPAEEPREVLLAGEQETGAVIRAAGEAALLQDRHDHYELTGAGLAPSSGRRSGTWLSLCGERAATAVFLRHGWEEFPKGLRWNGKVVDVQLWPGAGCPPLDLGALPQPAINVASEAELRQACREHPQASISLYRFVTKGMTDWTLDSVVPLMRRARELEAELLLPQRFAYYYLLESGANGRHLMKTHELLLAALPGRPEAPQLSAMAAAVRRPPVVSASPEWNCRTLAFGPSIPYGQSRFTEVDEAMARTELDDVLEFREKAGLYGALDFGDHTNGNPATAGPLWHVYGTDARIADRIGWMNTETQDSNIGAWLQYLRTADPRILYHAESHTEHVATVDQAHAFQASGRYTAVTFRHDVKHYGYGPTPNHTRNDSYLLGYYVTGNRQFREAALANADHFVQEQRKSPTGWYYPGAGPGRENSAPFACVINAYLLTWDETYRRSLDDYVRVMAPVFRRDEHGGFGTLEYPGSALLRLTPHPAFREFFARTMVDTRARLTLSYGADFTMPGLAWMWETTGDPTYPALARVVLQWHTHNLRTRGESDRVRRRVFGMPDMNYGMTSGYVVAGMAMVEEAERRGVDLEAAAERLRTDRAAAQGLPPGADTLCYSYTGYDLDGKPGTWYPPRAGQQSR